MQRDGSMLRQTYEIGGRDDGELLRRIDVLREALRMRQGRIVEIVWSPEPSHTAASIVYEVAPATPASR